MNTDTAFEIWPDGPPENPCEGLTETIFDAPGSAMPRRWIRNIHRPTLTHFPAKGETRGAILVIPGGAFLYVSIDNEGIRVAEHLASLGFDAFVLKYRCAPLPDNDADALAHIAHHAAARPRLRPGQTELQTRTPAALAARHHALADGRQAFHFLKANAEKFGIDPARLGALGFSAGGGIAAHLAFSAPAEVRPAYAGLIYAGHAEDDTPKAGDPPVFLAVAADDPVVPPFAVARLAEACHRATVPVTFHLYGNGGHGFGAHKSGTLSDRWMDDFAAWLDGVCRM